MVMGSPAAALFILLIAPFVIAGAIFLFATRKSDSEFLRIVRLSIFVSIAGFMVFGQLKDVVDWVQREPTRHVLHIRHEFATIDDCEAVGTEAKPITLVTASFPTNAGYDHPVPIYKDENHFEKMQLVQFGARVVGDEPGERTRAQAFFPLPLVNGRPAPDDTFSATIEVPGHGRCEIDLMIAREVEVVRPG